MVSGDKPKLSGWRFLPGRARSCFAWGNTWLARSHSATDGGPRQGHLRLTRHEPLGKCCEDDRGREITIVTGPASNEDPFAFTRRLDLVDWMDV